MHADPDLKTAVQLVMGLSSTEMGAGLMLFYVCARRKLRTPYIPLQTVRRTCSWFPEMIE